MLPLRRKNPLFNSETVANAMKARKNNSISIFVVVFSLFLFGVFIYNEDLMSIPEFPFSWSKSQEMQEGVSKPEDSLQRGVGKLINEALTAEPIQRVTKTIKEPIDLKSIVAKEKEEKVELQVFEEEEEEKEEEEVELPPEDCDLFTGEWVFDNVTHPLYKEDQCEFLTAQVTCVRNGRPDSMYQNWRWQPRDCSLPK